MPRITTPYQVAGDMRALGYQVYERGQDGWRTFWTDATAVRVEYPPAPADTLTELAKALSALGWDADPQDGRWLRVTATGDPLTAGQAGTDPWRWTCRSCRAEGEVVDGPEARQARDAEAYAHRAACPCRSDIPAEAAAGRRLCVWSYAHEDQP